MFLQSILFLMPFSMALNPLAIQPKTMQIQEGYEYRASFDLGSGTVKIQAALIDVRENKIAQVLHTESNVLLVREAIERNNGKIPEETIEAIKREMLEMRTRAEKHGKLTQVAAGATEAYRLAANGQEAIERLSQETGIPIYLLPQEEEASLGLASLQAEGYLIEGQNTLIWENGGGSTQMTAIVNGNPIPYNLQIGKVAMKNQIILNIQGKDSTINTPNPISMDEALQAIEWSKMQFQTAPSNMKQEKILGIGAMFPNIKKAVGKSTFTRSELMAVIEQRIGQTDEEMGQGDSNASYMLSDLLFLYGAMQALGIEEVECPQLSGPGNTSGFLTDPSKWS